jgi:hypothetical protein
MKRGHGLRSKVREHAPHASAIIGALINGQLRRPGATPKPARVFPFGASLNRYQRFLFTRFADVIAKPSFDYVSKTADSWLLVGDRRREIASDISLVIERHGLGLGMLVLHLQQIVARHVLTQIEESGRIRRLAVPTECLRGSHGELVLSVPIREFRRDFQRLAALNIAKPQALWTDPNIITHERDNYPCHYCSCPEINPAEVVIDLDGPRHGLSRHYSVGFTFAPFGNPLSVVHFLAWDRARHPLNMNRVPMTVSDLVKLTREINLAIRAFFAETGIRDYPSIDGVSNGWAGNTIYHQHFQFFCPEYPAPITRVRPAGRTPVIRRDDVTVQRLDWPVPVYRIHAEDALNTGLVGNDLAGIWRLLGGTRKVPYKPFRDGYTPTEGEKVHAHTQNLYVPGRELGTTAFLVLRDRERVDFKPGPDSFVNRAKGFRAQRKENLGVLETTGTLIVDDRANFEEMKRWQPADLSLQVRQMIHSIAPDDGKAAEFERTIHDLFPPIDPRPREVAP